MAFIKLLVSTLLLTPLLFGGTMKEGDYSLYLEQIVYPFAKQAQKDFNLFYIGRGGQLAKEVGKVAVDFVAYRKGSLEEAREIEIVLTERLLQALNTHEKTVAFPSRTSFPCQASLCFNCLQTRGRHSL